MAQNNNDREEYFKDRAGSDEARFHAVPHDEEGGLSKKRDKMTLN